MESQFRQLGMQIKLESGRFYLLTDYIVCQEGENLTPDQSKMIVRFILYCFLFFLFYIVKKYPNFFIETSWNTNGRV
jgi:hypothetical protein